MTESAGAARAAAPLPARPGRALAAALAVAAASVAAGAGAAPTGPPPRPAACDGLRPPGPDLQQALDAAAPGGAVCLAPGNHGGPLSLGAGVTLWGAREAVIRSSGRGSTVTLAGEGARLLGVTVDGSGGRFDLLDAAVRVGADGARVEGVLVRNALFGLLAEQCRDVVLRDNVVLGQPGKVLGMRGDGIRLWEVRESTVAGNRLEDSRDIVVWYSPRNRIANNTVLRGRYGTHFMYSHHNEVVANRYDRNVVGIFAMYSRHLRIVGNRIERSGGAAGVGLGAKDSGDMQVRDNWFLGNTTGIYLDTSPLQPENHNRFERNVVRFSGTGVLFHGVVDRNHFEHNSLRDNDRPVAVEGRGDARAAEWRRNDWGDYAGYDLDGDGVGDVAYELRSLSGELTDRRPVLAWFRGTPAMALVELVGRALPLFRPTTLLVDPEPRMTAPRPERSPEAAGAG